MMMKTKGKIMKSTKGTKIKNNGVEMMCKQTQGLNHNIKPHFNSRPTASNGFVVLPLSVIASMWGQKHRHKATACKSRQVLDPDGDDITFQAKIRRHHVDGLG